MARSDGPYGTGVRKNGTAVCTGYTTVIGKIFKYIDGVFVTTLLTNCLEILSPSECS